VTCRHYRRGISGGLGLCGLDPRHGPVTDTDVRACWVGAPPSATDGDDSAVVRPRALAAGGGPGGGGRTARTFVPVEELVTRREAAAVALLERETDAAADEEPVRVIAPVMAAPDVAPGPERPVPGRWWLWGDPDPWPERLGDRWA